MTVRNANSMGDYGATWTARGYAGQGAVESLIDSLAGRTVLVCGNGAGVFAEYEEACAIVAATIDGLDPIVFAVNDVGMYLPRVDHWVSLHVDKLLTWRAVRWAQESVPAKVQCHSDTARPWLDWYWQQTTPQFCLSGYYAMQLAWIMGAERIVLCGCPGDGSPRWFEHHRASPFDYGSGQDTKGVRHQLYKEMARVPEFKAAVRSMSGWTREYFGAIEGG